MHIVNYLEAIIDKIDNEFIYINIGNNEVVKWPKNKVSDLEVFEGKKLNLILGGDDILEEQKNILYKKIINEIIDESN